MMFYGMGAVFLREMMILRKRFKRYIIGMMVAPLLYIIAFGTAMGADVTVDGRTYLEFLLPGLIAMSTMIQSYGMAAEINISRFYLHMFEEFQSAPITNVAYVLGEVLAGITRALIGVAILLGIGAAFGVSLHVGPFFWLAAILNAFCFASLAVLLAMIVKKHSDQAALTTFVITPMAFLGGTFFPLDRLPEWAQYILHVLPLTHASQSIRAAAFNMPIVGMHYVVLVCVGVVLFSLALMCVGRARD